MTQRRYIFNVKTPNNPDGNNVYALGDNRTDAEATLRKEYGEEADITFMGRKDFDDSIMVKAKDLVMGM